MAPAAEPTAYCSECRIHYPNYMAYNAHRKRKMKEGDGHIHCGICGMDFRLRETLSRHHKQEHPHEQDIDCPGCGLHFTRIASLFNHFESDSCTKISKNQIEYARWARSRMGRGLAELNGEDPKEYFGKFLSSGRSVEDEAPSSVGFHRRFLGHLESIDPASSTLSSKGKVAEGSTLSVEAQSSLGQPTRGPEPRPMSFDTTEFPTLAETATSKKQTGSQGQKRAVPDSLGKGKAREASSLLGSARSSEVQHASGPDLRPGSLNKTEFPTLSEANAHKENTQRKNHIVGVPSVTISCRKTSDEVSSLIGVKTLHDSRWAPKKMTPASTHPIQSRGTNGTFAAPPESQQQKASHSQAAVQTLSEQEKAAPDQHQPGCRQGIGPQTEEVPASGSVEPSETTSNFWGTGPGVQSPGTSLKTVPPHLRGKLLAAPTDSSEISSFSVEDQPTKMLPPHLQGGLGSGPTEAYTEASKDENDASTIHAPTTKYSDQGTMGLPSANSRDSRASSVVPPHLRGKVKEPESTDDGGVREDASPNRGATLDHQEQRDHANSAFATATETQFSGALSILTGQSTVGSCSEAGPNRPSPSQEPVRNAHGNTTLPPHLRKGISGNHAVTASSTKPVERDYSPTPSMSTGQSTPEPANAGGEPEAGQLRRSHDNFGVVPSVKSYATVAKSREKTPPQFRGRQVESPKFPAPPRSVGTQTGDISTDDVSEVQQNIVLKPSDTSVDAASTMDPQEEGIGLEHHDPQHPLFDARKYLSQYTKRFQCPIPSCGKAFKSMQGITGHLASDVHRRPLARFQCPHCLRNFASTAALTAHSESQGRRCEIRNTAEFRPFLDQLTAGIADVEGIHDDQTNRYIVTDEAVYQYGDDELRGRMKRVLEQQEMKQIEEKGGNYWDGKHIAW